MKQLFVLLMLSLPFLVKSQQNPTSTGIEWAEDLTWEQIKSKAKAENKFIFVDAYATWCLPCKKMDKEVYPDNKVGEIVNPKFISVKVQMDETSKDNEHVKAWYPVAQELQTLYQLEGYPSFLFFNPDGKLAHRSTGLHTSDDFIALVKDALTDPDSRYKKNIEQFKRGLMDYIAMPQVAREAWKMKDKDISIAIAREFKEKYVDKLGPEEAFTKLNLSLLAEFSLDIPLRSDDRYFRFFYRYADQADSIINRMFFGKAEKIAERVVLGIIRKEEIKDKVYKEGKAIIDPKPDWNEIRNSIEKKYGKQFDDKFFPNTQISFYESAGDWKNYVKYVNKRIKKFPPKVKGNTFGPQFGDAWHLNSYTWTLFKNCNDKKNLKKGISWINLSLQLEDTGYATDTKANLLYKIGKVKEAIALQERAVVMSKNDTSIKEALSKMKAGLPTWPKK